MNGAFQLILAAASPELSRFGAMLQQGVTLRVSTGCSLRSFLTDQLGIAPGYVKDRITTVFLDGQVVDSLDDAVIQEGCLLALSAALPGLAGATLRSTGPYSAMRAAITRPADAPRSAVTAGATGTVRVKLFNLLIEELGPVLLAHGIVLEHSEALEALGGWDGIVDELPPGAQVVLRVHFAGASPGAD